MASCPSGASDHGSADARHDAGYARSQMPAPGAAGAQGDAARRAGRGTSGARHGSWYGPGFSGILRRDRARSGGTRRAGRRVHVPDPQEGVTSEHPGEREVWLVETEMIAEDHMMDSHRRRSPWHPDEAGFSNG